MAEVAEVRARQKQAKTRPFGSRAHPILTVLRQSDLEVAPQHLLVPAQGDPEMWAVRVKVRNLRYLFTMSDIQ